MAETGLNLGNKNVKDAAMRLFVIGGSATFAKIASDSLVNRLFVVAAGAPARSAEDEKKYQLYRGGIQIGAGFLLGKALWNKQRDLAMGLALGCAVGGFDRIAVTYGWSNSIRDMFSGSRSAAALGGERQVRALDAPRQSYTGNVEPRLTRTRFQVAQ